MRTAAPRPPFLRDLKDTQSTFTGALMALQPTLLVPPFLLLLLPLLLLLHMSSAGLGLLYRGVINHATGSSAAQHPTFGSDSRERVSRSKPKPSAPLFRLFFFYSKEKLLRVIWNKMWTLNLLQQLQMLFSLYWHFLTALTMDAHCILHLFCVIYLIMEKMRTSWTGDRKLLQMELCKSLFKPHGSTESNFWSTTLLQTGNILLHYMVMLKFWGCAVKCISIT